MRVEEEEKEEREREEARTHFLSCHNIIHMSIINEYLEMSRYLRAH